MVGEQAIGTLYGLSVGPGDPELLTLKALRLLQQVPVVAFPAGRGGKPGMAEQIIAPWVQPHQQRVALTFPYVHDRDQLQAAWQAAAIRVWTFLRQGQDVVFACEGDVSFYSTFTYLAQALQQLPATLTADIRSPIPIVAVPGVCSPMAAAAALTLPLTMADQRLLVLPALYAIAELETALTQADVIVLLKVSSVYAQVWPILQRHNLLANSAVIVRATGPDQQIYVDLSSYPDLQLPYFSLLIIWPSR
ncbi:precorrin-2 C(20)-methyltransferase [Trichothermofontia sichuanensis B231]|uniref:precorrin-2 C(20)-methyltransferase n=1 Tax=Trichothermofontia sichuanensis TaxID=3045816 RepID=UPI002245E786|nr:precorrin-2 C(20)-methyltransferase [Trichothermofontia sichuanensis]UZQ53463.1 precorrin-2 C(20)-methyltransferase [Trichothermofontia sichuanensis B231]